MHKKDLEIEYNNNISKINLPQSYKDLLNQINNKFPALNTSFELAHPVTDFDLVLIQIYWTGDLNNYGGSRVFNVDDFPTANG